MKKVFGFLQWFLLIALVGATGCSATKTRFSPKKLSRQIEHNPVFAQSHCGFVLYDLAAQQTIYSYNGDRYFTPASNTKIFTLYTSLRLLSDSIPALRYVVHGDSLIFWGTGDPSFLHPDLRSTRAYDFLSQRREKLFYATAPYEGAHFGPGWAWDDYNDEYSPEKAVFPIYGNFVRFGVQSHTSVLVQPDYFAPNLNVAGEQTRSQAIIQRKLESNTFSFQSNRVNKSFTQDVPFRYSSELLLQLLRDTINREVTPLAYRKYPTYSTLYSLPADSLYKRMMQESDNFLAEQLLLLCSTSLPNDTAYLLGSKRSIAFARQRLLADLPDKLVWVDGSGLSRYNLFTPRSIVALWLKLYQLVPRERLFSLLVANGQSGTLSNSFGQARPFIFGKTGSLSNNHCLSGFLVTQSGKTLVFSFMHSNFVLPSSEIRREMERILTEIYQKY